MVGYHAKFGIQLYVKAVESSIAFTENPTLLDTTLTVNKCSLDFNGHFPAGPGLANIRMSQLWILLELKMITVVLTIGATRSAKLQSNRHHQQINNQLFTSCRLTKCQSTEGKESINADHAKYHANNEQRYTTTSTEHSYPFVSNTSKP